MFSSGQDKKGQTGVDMPSIIAKGLVISGDLECDGELQVNGIVAGNIRAQKLTLGDTAHVTGDIEVDTLIIHGKVDGNIVAHDVAITASGRVKGDVTNSSLSIEPGAIIDGHCRHSDNPRGGADTVALFDKAENGRSD
ncbi:bactofilin family protein [Sneathiella glossodoripedis]|uniref:bactofilin family protein n=1 Tax=Sneathiella glossodoripedis TaxID=418853 RepID=UPI000470B655|nr:polymer-forming cytoskeletal protein [Sneathiella glossodoripedis]